MKIRRRISTQKEVSDLSEESSENGFYNDREEILFMEIKTNIDEDKGIETMESEEEKNVETEGEVGLEEELS
jgi:hypothetical protein